MCEVRWNRKGSKINMQKVAYCNYAAPKIEKQQGEMRRAMEQACHYLAKRELGLGLHAPTVASAYQAISKWKISFVEFMQHKPNLQAIKACDERILIALTGMGSGVRVLTIEQRGAIAKRQGYKKGIKCECPNSQHLLGKAGANALADNIIMMSYEIEARALGACIDDFSLLEEPLMIRPSQGISRWFTRDVGPVEWGHSLCDEEYLPRQMAEVPLGSYYEKTEDEHAHDWHMADDEYSSEDEVDVREDENGIHEVTDWQRREIAYGEMISALIQAAKAGIGKQKILAKAVQLKEIGEISNWQMMKLRQFAGMVSEYLQSQAPMTDQSAGYAEEEIPLPEQFIHQMEE